MQGGGENRRTSDQNVLHTLHATAELPQVLRPTSAPRTSPIPLLPALTKPHSHVPSRGLPPSTPERYITAWSSLRRYWFTSTPTHGDLAVASLPSLSSLQLSGSGGGCYNRRSYVYIKPTPSSTRSQCTESPRMQVRSCMSRTRILNSYHHIWTWNRTHTCGHTCRVRLFEPRTCCHGYEVPRQFLTSLNLSQESKSGTLTTWGKNLLHVRIRLSA
ncbi:uncharacterized protein LOC123515838 [Portunus trituberculatus]|uniref:uncharacterized protein LOC123515838 n=1 Tax=Portunus trituberculatus TaxID=210409 RepID=UPI001E1D072E|nr:uncharacterized protein LOC123515838 [Portunus trituberculatus]